jgi:hypothetical protein
MQRLEEKSFAPVRDRTPVVQSIVRHCTDRATLPHAVACGMENQNTVVARNVYFHFSLTSRVEVRHIIANSENLDADGRQILK